MKDSRCTKIIVLFKLEVNHKEYIFYHKAIALETKGKLRCVIRLHNMVIDLSEFIELEKNSSPLLFKGTYKNSRFFFATKCELVGFIPIADEVPEHSENAIMKMIKVLQTKTDFAL